MRAVIFSFVVAVGASGLFGGSASGADAPAGVTFERDIEPILTRAGCNAGACHGKASGQNGFKLSLLGFDPEFDHIAIAREAGGRRVFPALPEQSLVLLKASGGLPHGGGQPIDPSGPFYETLRSWIAAGLPRTAADAPKLQRVAVEPAERRLDREESFNLHVTAFFSDGSSEDVTHLAAYGSSESTMVAVDPEGRVKAGKFAGEATISARYEGMFANCDVSIPLPGEVPAEVYAALPRSNFIDDHVWTKLKKLGLTPSAPAGDPTFLRRAYLDVIGRLPTPEEAREFLADSTPDKRARLVDRLLDRPEYADHWANKWMDLLRPNPYRVGIKAVFNLDGWIRDAFRRNLPYDQFVREIVTARGSTFEEGPATIFRDHREPIEVAPVVSQLFLGIRLDCAKCHHHPFESWGQEQFYEFAAFFARVGRKGTGLSPPISGSEEMVFTAKSGSVEHPLTGKALPPKPLFGSAPLDDDPEADPREALARWMTAPDNRYFAQVMANRVWADMMGVGVVDPVDDIRATNPPSNGPLLDALADDFRSHGYDVKHLIRTIMTSSVYGLSSEPNDRNVADTRNFSRYYRQRLRAEILLDAISDVTDVADDFQASPPRSLATTTWTTRIPSLFLDTFGRPDPNQDPPCERTSDTAVVQALHLMNSPGVHQKLSSDEGRVAALAKGDQTPRAIVDELYLLAYSRPPTEDERSVAEALFPEAAGDRRGAVEDLLWALLNSPEFVFKD
ncbi:DUF1549 and DUF1553 domain-containing protein [Planctomyces sp. SH-PL62]|uniref:DUF1549 and DUF1553 domain-containing protein n=1 Tax=Planctomyces sp. SH-PL62 TaxID=1636152 RepID=UPI00078D39C3|nr:DUF1549 and DUF1553 domain-containing protein [Planctomyces sp. SH-PL62]AMV38339.1 hypothetical protein VT85_12955 [Planctomyces sp. SH-PL62]